jgi:hypothetical protein
MLKKLISRFKKKDLKKDKKKYPNRFLKFYYENQNRLNKERRSSYSERKKKGICVRCSHKAVRGIVFCKIHQKMQKNYNKIARKK